jgi:hypothetical protein
MPRIERDRELARSRKRKVQLKKFTARYAKATSHADKEVIAAKVRRMSPFFNLEERAAQLKDAQKAK